MWLVRRRRWTLEALAERFRVRPQRVMAILALKVGSRRGGAGEGGARGPPRAEAKSSRGAGPQWGHRFECAPPPQELEAQRLEAGRSLQGPLAAYALRLRTADLHLHPATGAPLLRPLLAGRGAGAGKGAQEAGDAKEAAGAAAAVAAAGPFAADAALPKVVGSGRAPRYGQRSKHTRHKNTSAHATQGCLPLFHLV